MSVPLCPRHRPPTTCWAALLLPTAYLVLAAALTPAASRQTPSADPILRHIRQDKLKVDRVRAVEITGTVRKLVTTLRPPASPEEELRPYAATIQWNDRGRYVRVERWTLPEGVISITAGFDGSQLLNNVSTSSASIKMAAPAFGPEQLKVQRRHAARFALAFLLSPDGTPPDTAPITAGPHYIWTFGSGSLDRTELVVDRTTLQPQVIRFRIMTRRFPGEPEYESERELRLYEYRRYRGSSVPTRLLTYEQDRLVEQLEVEDMRFERLENPEP